MSEITTRPRIRSIVLPVVARDLAGLGAASREVLASSTHEFTAALVTACERASMAAGFGRVEVRQTDTDFVRVVATNAAGQALVTELHLPLKADAIMSTEVVGIHDGSCHAVLDAYDLALEGEGVRSGPPERRFTGGVCATAAARALAASLVPLKLHEPNQGGQSNSKRRDGQRSSAQARSSRGQ